MDRHEAMRGYVPENVDLICRACDAKRQGSEGVT
jgi:hypothetical protein